MLKYFYGFRYFSGRHTTTGEPNKITGRMSIAGEGIIFKTKIDLENWLENEIISENSGCDGGERVKLNKKEFRNHHRGMSLEDFEYMKQSLIS